MAVVQTLIMLEELYKAVSVSAILCCDSILLDVILPINLLFR